MPLIVYIFYIYRVWYRRVRPCGINTRYYLPMRHTHLYLVNGILSVYLLAFQCTRVCPNMTVDIMTFFHLEHYHTFEPPFSVMNCFINASAIHFISVQMEFNKRLKKMRENLMKGRDERFEACYLVEIKTMFWGTRESVHLDKGFNRDAG